ncbi:Uu.00g007930.m01.CDS01 [Anthostomella pinea]|uniref:Uu.00g007930.m01.CDS01 n=1 Tax=Anthostomella pinea TaxID=933095 RepID=A0AAI8VXS4_9PEZI|nr:Uu.00g007930.m01.CDS01 [Anthostomella pinea]
MVAVNESMLAFNDSISQSLSKIEQNSKKNVLDHLQRKDDEIAASKAAEEQERRKNFTAQAEINKLKVLLQVEQKKLGATMQDKVVTKLQQEVDRLKEESKSNANVKQQMTDLQQEITALKTNNGTLKRKLADISAYDAEMKRLTKRRRELIDESTKTGAEGS